MMGEFKKYEEYKKTNIEWINTIPSDWALIRVKYLFSLITDPAPKNNNEELLSVYTDIGVRPRKDLEERGNRASSTDNYWKVKKGDLIVNKLLAWMGAIGNSEYNGVTSPAYDVLRHKSDVNPKFYSFLFRNKIIRHELKRYSKGIMDMRLRLYFDQFGRIRVPCPPLLQQNRIVSFIEKKVKQIDHFVQLKEKTITLLEERKAAIINQAVTKGLDPNVPMKDSGIEWLGEIPEHWEVKKLKYCSEIITDMTTKKEELEIYISLEKIKSWEGVYDLSIGDDYFESTVKKFKIGDVLFGRLRPYLAKVIVADVNGVCVGELLVLRPKKNIIANYLKYVFLNKEIINLIDSSTFGAKMPRAKWDDIGKIEIPIPSKFEQSKILSSILAKTSQIDKSIENAKSKIVFIKEYRESLISAAVTGKIDVRDYNQTTKSYATATNH